MKTSIKVIKGVSGLFAGVSEQTMKDIRAVAHKNTVSRDYERAIRQRQRKEKAA